MKKRFIAEKYLKSVTGANKLTTDNAIQANHLDIGKYVEETYMKQFHGVVTMTEADQTAIVTLPKEMEDLSYNIQITLELVFLVTSTVTDVTPYILPNKTTTSFKIKLANPLAASESVKVYWKVLG